MVTCLLYSLLFLNNIQNAIIVLISYIDLIMCMLDSSRYPFLHAFFKLKHVHVLHFGSLINNESRKKNVGRQKISLSKVLIL